MALRIILKEEYITYSHALEIKKLPTLRDRRKKLMLNFALKCVKNPKTSRMFPENPPRITRSKERFKVPHAYTERLKKSAIPAMARLLNENESK